ncbi:YkvA family protein [Bacillus pinisoli]|uniref:YkvA family protein n=1 Tax=Bacillus pinisoli TaxID=2901866 RepID=UPI001FF1E243|nr:YkvA family protein [Bacillus pinisoli]
MGKHITDVAKDNTIKRYRTKALQYINDRKKAKALIQEATTKTKSEVGKIESFRNQLLLLVDAFDDWVSGRYREVPYKTLTLIVIGILYFVVPTDFIPDLLIGPGYIDDATIIAFIFKQIERDLHAYKLWKVKQPSTTEENTMTPTNEE